MDPTVELLKQGLLGTVAGIFLWLYLREQARHDKTRAEKDALQTEVKAQIEARRVDAKDSLADVAATQSVISQTLNYINDKLSVAKTKRRG